MNAEANGIAAPDTCLTFGAYLDHWLAEAAKPSVRPSTFRSYRHIVITHLQPGLGHVPGMVPSTPMSMRRRDAISSVCWSPSSGSAAPSSGFLRRWSSGSPFLLALLDGSSSVRDHRMCPAGTWRARMARLHRQRKGPLAMRFPVSDGHARYDARWMSGRWRTTRRGPSRSPAGSGPVGAPGLGPSGDDMPRTSSVGPSQFPSSRSPRMPWR